MLPILFIALLGIGFAVLAAAGLIIHDTRAGVFPAETPEDEEATFFRNLGR